MKAGYRGSICLLYVCTNGICLTPLQIPWQCRASLNIFDVIYFYRTIQSNEPAKNTCISYSNNSYISAAANIKLITENNHQSKLYAYCNSSFKRSYIFIHVQYTHIQTLYMYTSIYYTWTYNNTEECLTDSFQTIQWFIYWKFSTFCYLLVSIDNRHRFKNDEFNIIAHCLTFQTGVLR